MDHLDTTKALLLHTGWLRALARSLVVGEDSVEDVVQETWLTAFRRPPRHHGNLRS